ncbi:dihydropyrimidinase [Pararhizobium polonicum]|uniref:Dihydropyrimidinase n=1 Tax=Pararhizobium polonicum TaxID=1612624 RepID=A0A1C7NX23_9HYPH|nr:dihydropyrimidinase [Pararhizobium polonicum]OBZ93512.1 dihydropyrimidinase [Pararhizobium polonicum]
MNPPFDLVIRNARLVTASEMAATDIGLRGEEITAIGHDLRPGLAEYDAAGHFLLPGGVDSHCHIEQMTAAGIMNADSWESASRAALHGGTTTIIPFAAQHRGKDLTAVVADYHVRAEIGAMTDYAFHMIVTEPTEKVLTEDLPALIAAGHGSIKVFMTYDPLIVDDGGLLALLTAAKAAGAMVCVHAENHAMIKWATARLLAEGKTAPQHQAAAHPRLAETEAISRLIALAELTRQPVMIFHVSTANSLDLIRAARARGVRIWAETCPHYLYLTDSAMERPGNEGAKWMCSPPLRGVADQAALWAALRGGDLDIVSSDHAPFRPDATGKFAAGPDVAFNRIANGMPGLQTRMPLLIDAALRGKLTLPQVVELGATAPARIYNLGRKGRISVGADADLVLWNPDSTTLLSDDTVQDGTGYTPYPGMELRGAISAVWRRGKLVLKEGELLARPGEGRFLPRSGGDAARWDS